MTNKIKKGIFGKPVKVKSHGTFDVEAFKKWSEERQKLNEELAKESKEGSFSDRVDWVVYDESYDRDNPMDLIKAILQVADERKL